MGIMDNIPGADGLKDKAEDLLDKVPDSVKDKIPGSDKLEELVDSDDDNNEDSE